MVNDRSLHRAFEGKRVLVTGASSGLGAEFVRQFHAYGASVTAVARREARLQQLAAELEESRRGGVTIMRADLENDEDVARVCARIVEDKTDIFINNAGCGSFGCFEKIPIAHEQRIIDLNVSASVRLSHSAMEHFKSRGKGSMLLVSSIAALQPVPYMATYSASKAFNFFHGVSLYYEMKRYGIPVVTLCPGPTATEFGGVARFPGSWTNVTKDSPETVVRAGLKGLVRRCPVVIPCWRPKWYALFIGILPLRMRTAVVACGLQSALPGAQWT